MEIPTSERLPRSWFIAGLPPPLLARIVERARVVVFSRGQRLWSEGDPHVSIGLVVSGQVKSTRRGARGEVVVDLAFPGDVVGDVAFALGGPHIDCASCLRKTRVLLIPSQRLREAFREDPSALFSSLFSLARRAQRLQRLAEGLTLGSVHARLAAALLDLVERSGMDFPGGTLVPLRLSRADLAALGSTSAESVSRTLASWTRQGLLTVQPAGYLVHHVEALRILAGGHHSRRSVSPRPRQGPRRPATGRLASVATGSRPG